MLFVTLVGREPNEVGLPFKITEAKRMGPAPGSKDYSPGSSGVLGNKLLSDEHAFIPYCDTGRSRIGVGSRGGAPGS